MLVQLLCMQSLSNLSVAHLVSLSAKLRDALVPYLASPYFTSDFGDEGKFALGCLHGHSEPGSSRNACKSALRRETNTIQLDELGCLVDTAFDGVLIFKVCDFSRD